MFLLIYVIRYRLTQLLKYLVLLCLVEDISHRQQAKAEIEKEMADVNAPLL